MIIDAAAGVFARLGYDRARMADVVEASGLTKGSVYFHFDSKEALAVAVLTIRQERWITDISQALEKSEPGMPRLQALLPAMLALHATDPDAWVVSRLSQNLAEFNDTRELASAMAGRWIALVTDLIRDAHHTVTDAPDAPDPAILAMVLVAAFDGLKTTIDILGGNEPGSAGESLARAGEMLERMLFGILRE